MMVTSLKRRRFTVDEFHRMARTGILHEDDRLELIDGEVVEMAPIRERHAFCVVALTEEFSIRSAGRYVVSPQNPVRLSRHSELYPDLLLLRPPRRRYAQRTTDAGDVVLVIEVADATLATDRRIKMPRYAAAAIPEAWLVNLRRNTVEVHRDPRDGRYQQVTIYHKGEAVTPLVFPDIAIDVDAILG